MLALVAAITLTLNLGDVVRGAAPLPAAATCGIRTVSYRFVGDPGRAFRYEGDTYHIPRTGSIELIAGRRTKSYEIDGRPVPLDLSPIDGFGSRIVELPSGASN